MSKARAHGTHWETRARTILSRNDTPDVAVLIDLIHEVNPTGRGRAADESAGRYALKSRLQSLLLRVHGDDLEVCLDPNNAAIVSIRHLYHRHDACHAVLADLEDDVRSRIQRELDLGPDENEPTPRKRGPSNASPSEPSAIGDDDDLSVDDLLAAGKRAQAEYDYEAAQRYFERAVRESGGRADTALADLELRIDLLGADAEALSLAQSLPAKTLAEPAVAGLLVVAAARSGDQDSMKRFVDRAPAAQAAAAYLLLARRALDEEDDERVSRYLRTAQAKDPKAAQLSQLTEALEKLRSKQRAPDEARLLRLLEGSMAPSSEAQALAKSLLERFPESETARRAQAQIEERLRREQGKRHLAHARSLLATNEDAALEPLQKALACPLPPSDREAAILLVEEITRRKREGELQKRAEQVSSLLAQGDLARGLADYAELPVEVRTWVKPPPNRAVLAWMDRLLGLRGSKVRAMVDAVLALDRAISLAGKDLSQAASLLAGHEALLESIPNAVSILEGARLAAQRGREAEATEHLRAAEAALAARQLVPCREFLARVNPRYLSKDDAKALASLEAALAAAEGLRAQEQTFERLRSVGAFASARAIASELRNRTVGAEAERWDQAIAAIGKHIETTFAPRVEEHAGGPELLSNFVYSHPYGIENGSAFIDEEGNLYDARFEHAWLFIRVYHVPTGRVVRTLRMRTDAPFYEPSVFVMRDRLALTGSSGELEFSLPNLEICRRFTAPWDRRKGERRGFHSTVLADTNKLWLIYEYSDYTCAKSFDLDGATSGKTIRHVKSDLSHTSFGKRPCLMLNRHSRIEDNYADRSMLLYDANGVSLGQLNMNGVPLEIASHPSGSGYVLLVRRATRDDRAQRLLLVELSESLAETNTQGIEGVDASSYFGEARLATSIEQGIVFLLVPTADSGRDLIAFRSQAKTENGPPVLVELHRTAVPKRTSLIQNVDGKNVFAMVDGASGDQDPIVTSAPDVQLLGEEPVSLRDKGPFYKSHADYGGCFHSVLVHSYAAEIPDLYWQLLATKRGARAAMMSRLAAFSNGDPQKVLGCVYTLIETSWFDEAEAMRSLGEKEFPSDSRFLVARFAIPLGSRSFETLHERLVAEGPDAMGADNRHHYEHFLAVCFLAAGDLDSARSAFERAQALKPATQSDYHQTPVRETLDALKEPLGDADLALDAPLIRQHVALLRVADRELAAGNFAKVASLLERPIVDDLSDCQLLARRAEAFLGISPTTPEGRFQKALALATYAASLGESAVHLRPERFAPGCRYSEQKLQALKRQAIAWIEADHPEALDPHWKDE